MSLDQKRLQTLLVIASAGSFGAAAKKLGLSQPALSRSIALLEKAVGGTVLTRDRSGAKLTPLGEILAHRARALELLLARAGAEAKLFLGDYQGPLTIGASPVAAASIVPQAVLHMKKDLPRVALSIIEGVDDDLIARLTTGEIDLLVSPVGGARLPPEVEETPLTRGPITVIMRPANPLASRRLLTFDHLARAEWVLPIPGNALRRRLEAQFLLAGIPLPAHTIATNSISAIKALVRQSDRVAFMAKAMAEPDLSSGELVALPLADERFAQTLGLKRWVHHQPSPVAERFIAILRDLSRGRSSRPGASRHSTSRQPI